jgi:hypothetical protein
LYLLPAIPHRAKGYRFYPLRALRAGFALGKQISGRPFFLDKFLSMSLRGASSNQRFGAVSET